MGKTVARTPDLCFDFDDYISLEDKVFWEQCGTGLASFQIQVRHFTFLHILSSQRSGFRELF